MVSFACRNATMLMSDSSSGSCAPVQLSVKRYSGAASSSAAADISILRPPVALRLCAVAHRVGWRLPLWKPPRAPECIAQQELDVPVERAQVVVGPALHR